MSVSCGYVTLYFGNTGTKKHKKQNKKKTGDKPLFKIPFPGTPIPITFNFNIGGSLGYNVYYDIYAKQFSISNTTELYAKAALGADVSGIAEIDVGAQGTIISMTAEIYLLGKDGSYSSSNSIEISDGKKVVMLM